jgi:hypothetical protein
MLSPEKQKVKIHSEFIITVYEAVNPLNQLLTLPSPPVIDYGESVACIV